VCDLETSRMGAPYIYDISRLRVNLLFQVGLRQFQLIRDTSRQKLGWTLPDTLNTVKCSWRWVENFARNM